VKRSERKTTINYRLAYRIGFHPWEDAATDPPFVEKISELFGREEKGHEPPFGQALDLGTGSGIWGIELAKRGWRVTGIDVVEKALQRARERVKKAGVEMRLVRGDVTALRAAGVGSGYRLVLDTGTFHDLNSAQREAIGREVSAVAAPDATVLLLVWPKRRRPWIRGVSCSEIEAAFPGWRVTNVESSHFRLPKLMDFVLKPTSTGTGFVAIKMHAVHPRAIGRTASPECEMREPNQRLSSTHCWSQQRLALAVRLAGAAVYSAVARLIRPCKT
jgi:SAM-dependent methyltransferase